MRTGIRFGLAARGLIVVGAFLWSAPAARSAVMWGTGPVHASAIANAGGGPTVTDNPPDTTFNGTSGSNSASASTNVPVGGNTSAGVSVFLSVQMAGPAAGLMISGSTSCTGTNFRPGYTNGASASGNMPFTIAVPEILTFSASLSGYFGGANATIKDASNSTTLASVAADQLVFSRQQTVTLQPGVYNFTWQLYSMTAAGSGGGAQETISLTPEPATLASLTPLLVAGVTVRRRKSRASLSQSRPAGR